MQVTPAEYEDPSLDYKIACCKTIYLHHRFIEGDAAHRMIELDIVNALDLELDGTFIYTLSDEDIQ